MSAEIIPFPSAPSADNISDFARSIWPLHEVEVLRRDLALVEANLMELEELEERRKYLQEQRDEIISRIEATQ